MPEHAGPRGVAARRAYDEAQLRNPFMDHRERNRFERDIAYADWEDDHDGQPAPGFVEPKPRWFDRDDVGVLPFRVLHWGDDGKVRARDFWTGNRAREFWALHTACDRQAQIRHYKPWDPPAPRLHSPCWNGLCALNPCWGIVHCDSAGQTWEQPEGTVYNPRTGLYERRGLR
ncbi:hypothetical protein SAMN05421837_107389 [Amycolatopsis pretoriensis]|uniref:Uncharacterized protein n=1 Tax=Amycolatopsis pretoriensis TaxID=218821 RepID=A0A1H5R805_9PSEU|nr:hypothetical protein [Amycolatopsis pretoriensis]SEF34439.1 hypothetical protein SAMN05421837_107389 [Amycolatopsis pretoriensis]